ncbi:unnamed protein product, partial [Meganyctiphanes norvegica]
VIWYAAGGVLTLLLLGLLAVVYLRRRRGLTPKSENITKENLVHVTTRRASTHESENSLYGAVGPQTDTTGERGSTHDSENSMYGVVTGQQNDLSNKRGSAHDSTNSLYGAVLDPEDISQQSSQ